MNSEQILMYVVALILGMLLANMLKGICGCKLVEGTDNADCPSNCFQVDAVDMSEGERKECFRCR